MRNERQPSVQLDEFTERRAREQEEVKNTVLRTQEQLRELRTLDLDSIIKTFKGKGLNEFIPVALPLVGEKRLGVSYGYSSVATNAFYPDKDLRFPSNTEEEEPPKKYPHDVKGAMDMKHGGGSSDIFAAALVEDISVQDLTYLEKRFQTKKFGNFEITTRSGDPLKFGIRNEGKGNIELTVSDMVARSLDHWRKDDNEIKKLLPHEMFQCPFRDNDTGDFKITVRDSATGEAHTAEAENFMQAQKEMNSLFASLAEKKGSIHVAGSISLGEMQWNVEPLFGSSYVSVEKHESA